MAMAAQYKVEEVVEMLSENMSTLAWSVTALFDRQTPTEQRSEITAQHNGVGWNAADAPFMTSLAKQILAKREKGRRWDECITKRWNKHTQQWEGQWPYAVEIQRKYRRQITDIINSNLIARAQEAQNG